MSVLNKKLARDLWNLRWQALAIVAVIACGIGTFIMSASTVSSLEATRSHYYSTYRFANIFCDLKRAPEAFAQQLQDLPGVDTFETRIIAPVRLRFTDTESMAQALAISLPDGSNSRLNQLYLRSGRLPARNSSNEVAVSEAFAAAHRMQLGDSLSAIIYGQTYSLTIVGIVLSPEFIYEISPSGLLPDSKSFGILWLPRRDLEGSTKLEGAFNSIALTVGSEANESAIIESIDNLLARYGSLGAIQRKDQRSHRFVSSEMDELKSMGIVAPSIFLCVAAFLMNMVLSRLISTQREQIAALKAFGFTPFEIARYYLSMSWLLASVGTLAGVLVGIYLGENLTRLYSRFFHFPDFQFSIPLRVLAFAFFISFLAATVGVWTSIRAIMTLPPAEAMRPEPPTRYRKTWLDQLWQWIPTTPSSRMVIRHVTRHPRRAILSTLGISLAVAVLILGSFMQDSVFGLFDTMFTLSKKYDSQITFIEATEDAALFEVKNFDGVLDAEPFRTIPVRAKAEHRKRLVSIIGLSEPSRLLCLVDLNGKTSALPIEGALISRKLADVLKLKVGDHLNIEVLEERREKFSLLVSKLIDDAAGESIYMRKEALHRYLREAPQSNGIYIKLDPDKSAYLHSELQRRPDISQVVDTENLRASFLTTIAENVQRMRTTNLIFSLIIAVGVIYSTARISLAERSREFATLRVLGFSQREIGTILWSELLLLTTLAIPLGWLLGYGLSYATVNAFDRELFRMPLVVHTHTYAYAAIVVLIAMQVASWIVQQLLNSMKLVEVLKTRE